MANLVRSAKSGNDWTAHDLESYHITVKSLPPNEFFGSDADMSLDALDPTILTAPLGADNPNSSKVTTQYLDRLCLAIGAAQENQIDEFAMETLDLLGYQGHHIILISQNDLPLTICGDSDRMAQTDICLLHLPLELVLLVLVQNKILSNQFNAEPQAIAAAIAAFQFNNTKRDARGLQKLNSMMIPCITMSGTRPTFYLVPVSQELSLAVTRGEFPIEETTVFMCETSIVGHTHGSSLDMDDVEYRKLALQHFLAFKKLAKGFWEAFEEGV